MILAIKTAPNKTTLENARRAGLEAVELYLSRAILKNLPEIIAICRDFSFRYALHAPDDEYDPGKLHELACAVNSGVVVFHNIYWEDEWERIVKAFGSSPVKLCIENTHSVHEPVKFMRRYGMGRCVDLEHLQMECGGVYEEGFLPLFRQACHIHMTGYRPGRPLWHTHLYRSARHNQFLLRLIAQAGYRGLVVSEADLPFQTYDEFCKVKDFFLKFQKSMRI